MIITDKANRIGNMKDNTIINNDSWQSFKKKFDFQV